MTTGWVPLGVLQRGVSGDGQTPSQSNLLNISSLSDYLVTNYSLTKSLFLSEPASCIWPAGNQSTSYPVAFALVEKASKSGCWLKSGTRATFNAVEC